MDLAKKRHEESRGQMFHPGMKELKDIQERFDKKEDVPEGFIKKIIYKRNVEKLSDKKPFEFVLKATYEDLHLQLNESMKLDDEY